MPFQCYTTIALAALLLIASIVNGSWEGVGAAVAIGALGAGGLFIALPEERRRKDRAEQGLGPEPIWRERRGVGEQLEQKGWRRWLG